MTNHSTLPLVANHLQPLSPDPAVSRGPHNVRGLRGAARAGDLPAVPRGAGGAAVQEPRAGGARQENFPAGGGGEQEAAGQRLDASIGFYLDS